MGRHGKRRLSAEDREQWARLKQTVRPLAKPKSPALPAPQPGPPVTAAVADPGPLAPFRIGSRARTGASAAAEAAVLQGAAAASPVNRRLLARTRRGKIRPEARIDLHGMTQAQALPALTGFILRAVADGKRTVLVITGKGRGERGTGPIPERSGVLRHNLPYWLGSGQMAGLVMDVVQAHPSHGGAGAFYVFLRRRG